MLLPIQLHQQAGLSSAPVQHAVHVLDLLARQCRVGRLHATAWNISCNVHALLCGRTRVNADDAHGQCGYVPHGRVIGKEHALQVHPSISTGTQALSWDRDPWVGCPAITL